YHVLPAKPVYIKWKSLKGAGMSPKYRGLIGTDQAEADELLRHYDLRSNGRLVTDLNEKRSVLASSNGTGLTLVGKRDARLGTTVYNDTHGWEYALDNHKIQVIPPSETGGQGVKYLLRHPDGRPFVSDIDRVLYAEIRQDGQLYPGRFGKAKHWKVQ